MRRERRRSNQNRRDSWSHGKWFLIVPLLFASYLGFIKKPAHLTQFDSHAELNFDKKWGTYRSGHYFGIKKNEPYSLVAGLMWFKNKVEENYLPIKHWCNQFDRLSSYSWLKHDFDNFGIQEMTDSEFIITTKFLNLNSNSWMSKVQIKSTKMTQFLKPFSLLFYFATENPNDNLKVISSYFEIHEKKRLVIVGNYKTRTFKAVISVQDSCLKNVIHFDYLSTYSWPPLVFFKETVLANLSIVMMQSNSSNDENLFILSDSKRRTKLNRNNFIVSQIVAINPIEVEIFYNETDQSKEVSENEKSSLQFDKKFQNFENQFDKHFENTFSLKAAGFNHSMIKFAQSALSNMIGSIGYFYGYSLVQGNDNSSEPKPYGPLELMTSVPSRSFFPRGFLWDEGFHHLLISKFKPEISSKIIKSWLNLINVEGWIPREVILGPEAEARVPNEFIVQKTSNGNPPTLFLALQSMMESNQVNESYLKKIFPKLELWFNWYQSTQAGQNYSTYRWRGRDEISRKELNSKTLTSGLDDYPRSSSPSSDEIHLDLRCWMAFSARVMFLISSKIDHSSTSKYKKLSDTLYDNNLLDSLHWSNEHQMYCDWGWNSLKVRLVVKKKGESKERREYLKTNYSCVPEFGYVSIFPLLLNILNPDSPKLSKILSDISNPEHLWTSFGLRSLSKKSIYYNKYNTDVDPPYWRGPIWININYLALKSLKNYSEMNGKYSFKAKQIYTDLRNNLINNVFKEYLRTGFIYEQYDDSTGQGKGSHPFTGWSALIVLIMSEKY